MESLTDKDIEYITNAIDTHIRQHGVQVAQYGVLVIMKLQDKLPPQDKLPKGKVPKGKSTKS